jgi:hypothetical protein
LLIDFCLIFVPFGHYDEPEILPYENPSICPKGADVRQLEQKVGALDQAAPLVGWDLPEVFATLRRLLESRMGKSGKREYVQVLRLLETFKLDDLHGAVKDALHMSAISYDAIKHLVLCRIERRPPKLNLDIYPYLPRARVATTSAASYMNLLADGAS